MIEIVCVGCGAHATKQQRGLKYCTKECYWKCKVGVRHNWGAKISRALVGKRKSLDHVKKVVEANRGQIHDSVRGENHVYWKGDGVGYCAIHDWVRRRLLARESCEECGAVNNWITRKDGVKISYLHLANISGEYKRDVSDWKYLCPKCHSKLDRGRNSIVKRFK